MINCLLKVFSRQSSRSCPSLRLSRHHVVSMAALRPPLTQPCTNCTHPSSLTDASRQNLLSWYLQSEDKPNRCASVLYNTVPKVSRHCPSPLETRSYNQNDSYAAQDLRLEEEVRQEEADETQYSDNLDGDAFCALRSRGSSNLGGLRNVGGGGRALTLSQAFLFRGHSSTAP